MMKKNHKLYAVIVLVSILFYGIFKVLVCRLYSKPIEFSLELLGFDPKEALLHLNNFSRGEDFHDHYLGWFIYYPTYLLLHIIFIQLLFYQNKRLKKVLSLGLIGLIGLFLILILVGKWIELKIIYNTSYALFQHLFGLPFILLSIEGGRILYSDIEKKLKH